MPFTPFHPGLGAAFKGVGNWHFRFMVFGGSQVLMDVEPVVAMLQGGHRLHGYSHRRARALVIGFIAGLIGKPSGCWALDTLNIAHFPLSWRTSFIGALAGTLSHVALGAAMHPD